MTPCITAISPRICASMAWSRPGAGFDGAAAGVFLATKAAGSITPHLKSEHRSRKTCVSLSGRKMGTGGKMRLNAWGARKALVVAVVACMGTILGARQNNEQSTARTVAAKKDGRVEIDAHAAEWLKE